uniref:Transposase n=1 Tax=candidate division WOR-3 bacterium TaxID=2052148 RepID=A0A7C6AAC4_UNCW3
MVIAIPEGICKMKAKRSIIKINAPKYQKAPKKMKSAILNDLVEITHLHRKYLTTLLNNTGKVCYTPQGVRFIADPTITYTQHRGRKKIYTQELVPFLKILWELTGFRSSIHLVAFIRTNPTLLYEKPSDFEQLTKANQIKVIKLLSASTETKAKLLKISSATVDRLLRPLKEKYRLAHKYKPHPHASVLKKSIPVESYFDKPKNGPLGYTEIDLVHHCGSIAEGSFCYTLSETEINTGWTELRALKNKARVWTVEALADIDKSVPFKIHTRHVDNGSEFINSHVLAYTQQAGMNYTRSREYHKNDSPYVESRQWTMVRSYLGYRRYDTEKEYAILDRLDRLISIKHNYFMPSMKLIKKERIGGKVHKNTTSIRPSIEY